MRDVFARTVATYVDEAGAEAFAAKEARNDSGEREVSCYRLLEGVELQGKRALDVGCGFGRDVAALRRRGAEAYGCDISPGLLAKAVREVGPYFAAYDFRSGQGLPFGGGFDLIWACAVLVHVPRHELAAFLKTLWDGLAPGGRLVVITKAGAGESVSYNLGEQLPRAMVLYTVEEICAVLESLGGVVETAEAALSVTTYGDTMLGVRVLKP